MIWTDEDDRQLTSQAERLMKKSCWPEMCAFARAFFLLVSVLAALPLRIQLSALGLTHFLLGSLWSLDSPLFISFRPRPCRLLLLRRLDGQTLDTDESLHYRLVLFPSTLIELVMPQATDQSSFFLGPRRPSRNFSSKPVRKSHRGDFVFKFQLNEFLKFNLIWMNQDKSL
jgi:hypothetical protein